MKIILILVITSIITIGIVKEVSCWSLIDLFKAEDFKENNLSKTFHLDTTRDIILLPPLHNKTFFQAIADLSICRRREVRRFLLQYLTEQRGYIDRSFERSKEYLGIITSIFDKNQDIPKYLALLPILESGFNPYAVSRSQAVGLWQFIRGTSHSLGLRTDRWVDERRSIEKSTIAAIRHLRNLYRIFHSWELSLAAYNGGASYIKKAMLRSGAKDFWELKAHGAMNRETAEFIPRFTAITIIYENQWLFNIDNCDEKKPTMKTETIVLDFPVSIHHISKLANVPSETIRRLNPELKRNHTPPYYRKYELRLPVGAKNKLESDGNNIYKVRFKGIRKHIVRKGECISRIARRYRAKTKKIIILNDIKSPRLIQPGLTLYIPI
ncbi:MAG: transglycosylase SLT domain-containing protein [Spirochaetota bacterium]|nr:transglycosylase SLT domain-containing protein [Spirochaetota bacterium]